MPNLLPRQQAESLLINRDYNEAIKLYRQLIQDNPEDGFLFRGLVKACQGASKMDEAETWLNNFLSTGAHPDNALYGLGYLKYLTNRLKDSEFFLLKAVKVNPKHALAQKLVPRASFGVKMGGIDAENHEESCHRAQIATNITRNPTIGPIILRTSRTLTTTACFTFLLAMPAEMVHLCMSHSQKRSH